MNEYPASLDGRRQTDPVGRAELLLNQVFLGVFQNEAARIRFGFSQISLQPSSDGYPGWYLWFSDRPGAFLLKIIGSEVVLPFDLAPADTAGQTVRLAIYYYPSMEESCFEDFSWPEKILRCGDGFDSTGTPTVAGSQWIPASFYLVGWACLCWSLDHERLEILASSSGRLRDYRLDGLTVMNECGEPLELVVPGGRDRNLPGWELTCHLMDKMLLSACFQQRLSPLAVLVFAHDGKANYLHSNQKTERQAEPGIQDFLLATSLHGGSVDLSERCAIEYADGVRKRYGGEQVVAVVGRRPRLDSKMPFINPDWWRVKDMHLDPVVGGCCCRHDH